MADPRDNSDPSWEPTEEFRAPGGTIPPGLSLGVLPESPVIENRASVEQTPIAFARQKFFETLAQEDADLRVMATALKLRGYSVKTIATGLGVNPERIRRVLKQARRDGNLNDTLSDLTTEALPLAIEGLVDALENKEAWAIKDTLRGLGAFRTYTQSESGAGEAPKTLEVNFIMPANPMLMNPKGIVGAPRIEVIDAVQVQAPAAEVSRDGVTGGDRPQDGGGVRSGNELQEAPREREGPASSGT